MTLENNRFVTTLMSPTTMSFPLYCRPGGVIFLDDDRDYLEMLAEVMPLDWYARLFLRPVACIDLLLQEPPHWEEDAWAQQEIINRWREGASLIPQILQYWREDGTARFAFTRVCVVDYSMPAMSGLRVLSELTDWSGSRILLTGRADEQLAVSAFNRGLIDQFIPKQSPEIRLRLTDAIQSLRHLPDSRHQQIWRATLSREQHALLCDPAIAQELQLALGAKQQAQPHHAFAMAGEPARLYAALFAVHDDFSPGFMNSHERFIATCGERQPQD